MADFLQKGRGLLFWLSFSHGLTKQLKRNYDILNWRFVSIAECGDMTQMFFFSNSTCLAYEGAVNHYRQERKLGVCGGDGGGAIKRKHSE